PDDQHFALVLAMRNRINFLHHTYKAQQNVITFYERMMGQVPLQRLVPSSPNFYIQGAGAMDHRSYSANNSPEAALGDGNNIQGNANTQIVLGNTVSKRTEQIRHVDGLLESLSRDSGVPDAPKAEATKNLTKIKDELADEEHPDPTRISRWLEQAKHALKAFSLTHDVVEATKALGAAFGLLP
ncbi:MAG TPA: hypothetical protein VLJ83_01070, partial [Gemmatimonadaceae bacterium]|nr:hypothetical protein [Gemmatimonadaceae bacterium]